MIKEMTKRLLIICSVLAFCMCMGLNAFAADEADELNNADSEYLEEYDNYYQFEQDYLDSVEEDLFLTKNGGKAISGSAMLAGAVVCAIGSYLFLRRKLNPPKAEPYFRHGDEKHKIVFEKDIER